MKIIGDFHIHSRFARACSKNLTIPNLALWGKKKGINVLGTGDFTHPEWFKELRKELTPAEPGLYRYKAELSNSTRFLLTSEISNIYKKDGKVHKIHTLVFAPSLEIVEKINKELSGRGFNIRSDGRPILGQDVKDTAQIIWDISPDCVIIPAHTWTPWFSVFGSASGYDSLEECFGDLTPRIFAIETGLSSDPGMNRRVSKLDHIALISNSDAHSLENLGREANIFDTELSYAGIMDAIRSNDPKKFLSTIEFFPEHGKYYYDGHRAHNVSLAPQETKKLNDICPVCGKGVTVGVLHRVDDLADRPEGSMLHGAVPYKSLVPLREIIGQALGRGVVSKAVQKEYDILLGHFGNEFSILLHTSLEEIGKISSPLIAEGVKRVREGKLHIVPGYDGEYGIVQIFTDEERKSLAQPKLA